MSALLFWDCLQSLFLLRKCNSSIIVPRKKCNIKVKVPRKKCNIKAKVRRKKCKIKAKVRRKKCKIKVKVPRKKCKIKLRNRTNYVLADFIIIYKNKSCLKVNYISFRQLLSLVVFMQMYIFYFSISSSQFTYSLSRLIAWSRIR